MCPNVLIDTYDRHKDKLRQELTHLQIDDHSDELENFDVEGTPRQQPNIERLRDALTQRAAEWRVTLRSEPKVARLLLRRLIGPLVLYDESTRPDFIKADWPDRRLGENTRCGVPHHSELEPDWRFPRVNAPLA